MRSRLLILLLLLVVTIATFAQWGRRRNRMSTEIVDRGDVPVWEVEKGFAKDCFTFVRVQYSSSGYRGNWGGAGDWTTDWPDADLNLSYRLQQLTSLKVNPDPKILRLTDTRGVRSCPASFQAAR